MKFEEKLENEYKTALKAGDAIKVSTLRMLKAEINNVKLTQSGLEIKEGEIIKIVQRQIKQHRDSIEQFEKGNRPELAEKEKKELAILSKYMPEQLSEEELKKIITDAIKELGATGKKDMGKVIKTVMEKAKGKAEGKTVSQFVSGMLG